MESFMSKSTVPKLTENAEEQGHEPSSLSQELAAVPLSKRRVGVLLIGLLLLSGLGFLGLQTLGSMTAKPDKGGRSAKQQIAPVTVAQVTQKTVPIQLQAIGTVQASSMVAVTPQAAGRVMGVYFKKGQQVTKGQLLFELDDRTQQAAIRQARATLAKSLAAVRQAQANLAKDKGLVQQAQTTLNKDLAAVKQAQATLAKDRAQTSYTQATSKRYNDLYRQGGVSRDQAQQFAANSTSSAATLQVDQSAIANAQAVVEGDRVAIENAKQVVEGDYAAIANAQAVVQSDRAALDNMQVQATYTKIHAPIDGRAGNILVTEGNVVQVNSTSPLVNIAKTHPIQVSFAVPESNLPVLQRHIENGKLKVDVAFTGYAGRPISGSLTFLNNTVDNATGTIQLIGDFNNAEGKLFPGQFVKTTLTLSQEPNATVVPAQAVQNGPNGQFVFVVKPDKTVENVTVTASNTVNGLSVIQKGLEPGQQIVTDGQANLVTGSKIRIKTASDAEEDFSDLFGNGSNSKSDSDSGTTGTPKGNKDQDAAPSNQPSNSPPRPRRNPPAQAGGNS
jgi:membrane fusion protein, multidrug efflux system